MDEPDFKKLVKFLCDEGFIDLSPDQGKKLDIDRVKGIVLSFLYARKHSVVSAALEYVDELPDERSPIEKR